MPKWKLVLFSLAPALVLFLLIEGAAQLYWLNLKNAALSKVEEGGKAILANDAINFLKVTDPILGYKLAPNLDTHGHFTNSEGFPQRGEIETRRQRDSLRLVAVGESTTHGHNVDTGNYPSHLRNTLMDKAQPNYAGGIEVINGGVSGWVSDQWALYSMYTLSRYRPDIVFIYGGWNDLQSYPPGTVPTSSFFENSYGDSAQFVDVSALKSIVLGAALLNSLMPAQAPAYNPNAANSASSAEEELKERFKFLARSYHQTIDAFRESNPNVTIVMSTLAARWPHGTVEQFESPMGHIWWMGSPPGDKRDEAAEELGALNRFIRDFARENGLILVDTAQVFDDMNRRALFTDFAHFTDTGYAIVALNIYETLREQGVIVGDSADAELQALISDYLLTAIPLHTDLE